MSALREKVETALNVLRQAFRECRNPYVAYTGGKDSTVTLYLALRAKCGWVNAVFLDERDTFPEIWDMVQTVQRHWTVRVRVVRSHLRPFDVVPVDVLELTEAERTALGLPKKALVRLDPDSPLGTLLFKVKPLREFTAKEKVDGLITGVRRDEHPDRQDDPYVKVVDGVKRYQPILDFTEEDIWNFILCEGLPYCSLYEQGYRSLGTKSGTKKFSDLPAWEQDLSTPERAGRALTKEQRMALLRAMGYM